MKNDRIAVVAGFPGRPGLVADRDFTIRREELVGAPFEDSQFVFVARHPPKAHRQIIANAYGNLLHTHRLGGNIPRFGQAPYSL